MPSNYSRNIGFQTGARLYLHNTGDKMVSIQMDSAQEF